MDVAQPGRFINRDLASSLVPGESAEKQIDAFISHRHAKRVAAEECERDEEAAWRESERRHIAQRRARNRLEWIEHFESQADRLETTLGALVAECRQKADKLREGAA